MASEEIKDLLRRMLQAPPTPTPNPRENELSVIHDILTRLSQGGSLEDNDQAMLDAIGLRYPNDMSTAGLIQTRKSRINEEL